MLHRNQSSYFFPFNFFENFIYSCRKIENDPNYQRYITNDELLNLVRDENGNAKHTPRRSALAIQRVNSYQNYDALSGMIYQIKIAKKGCIGDDEYPVWHIDDSTIIFVNKKGEYSFHVNENIRTGNLDHPLTHLKIDNFLNQACLHYSKETRVETSNLSDVMSQLMI
ncbi:MAG: hypothetical protein H0U71_04905 [Gammaproteobacteria bacterium]|nr:hypothetical protein [Gammaproteobacteria bacterium]